jgi:predicted nucleic acid-binding protein
MKMRDHEKEVRRLERQAQHDREVLRAQIEVLKETCEALRLRAQMAERKAFEAEERWWSEEVAHA